MWKEGDKHMFSQSKNIERLVFPVNINLQGKPSRELQRIAVCQIISSGELLKSRVL
jgi:hypothetical protein